MRVRLINGVTAGLTSISSAFAKAHGDATKLQGALDSIKFKLAAGGALIGAGAFGFLMLDKAVKPAEEYAHQLNIMRMAGMSNLDIARATGDAWKNTGTVITTTATQNLRAILDLKNILGTMKDAEWALPIVTKVGAVMQSSSEGNIRNNAQDIAFQMAKALDIIGAARDPGTFSREAGLMSKVVTAFQNRVTPKQFQGVFQYARQAKFDLSDEFKYEFLPSLMLEMSSGASGSGGGSRGVGPMLAALYRVTNQGYINSKSVSLWEQLGLLKAGTALKTTTTGTVTAALNNRTLAAQNPFLYATQVLEPAIRKKYGNVSVGREREIIGELFRGNQLAAAAMMEFISKPQNYLRDQKIIRGAMPFNQAYDPAQKNDPDFQYAALRSQLDNLETTAGLAILPMEISALKMLNPMLLEFSLWTRQHPKLVKALMLSFAGLSAAMAFGGTVLLLKASFDGLALAAPVLRWAILGNTEAIVGSTGLVGAFGKLRFSLLGLGLVAFGVYELSKGAKGHFENGQWKPDAMKDSWAGKSMPYIPGIIAGWFSGAKPKTPNGMGVNLSPWQPNVGPMGVPPVVVHLTNITTLDGRVIAQSVSKHQGEAVSGPATGPSGFDTHLSMLHPDMAY